MAAETWCLLVGVLTSFVLVKFAADGDHHPLAAIHRFVKEHRR